MTNRRQMLVNKYNHPVDEWQELIMVDRNELFQNLKTWILQLPGVTQAPHRFGRTEFQIDGLEFMHNHGPSFFDIRLSKSDQATVLKSGTAFPHRFAPQAGW